MSYVNMFAHFPPLPAISPHFPPFPPMFPHFLHFPHFSKARL